MEPYIGTTGQFWTATQVAPLTYTLSPKSAPDLVMDDNAGKGAGATVSMWSPNGGTNQQWVFIPR